MNETMPSITAMIKTPDSSPLIAAFISLNSFLSIFSFIGKALLNFFTTSLPSFNKKNNAKKNMKNVFH